MTNQERFEALYNEADTKLADVIGFDQHIKTNYRERRIEFRWDKLHHREIEMMLDMCTRHGALLSISAETTSLISVSMTLNPLATSN